MFLFSTEDFDIFFSTAEKFNQIYSSTYPLSLVDNFNSKISDIIDSMASIEVKVMSHRKMFLWKTAPLMQRQKRQMAGKLESGFTVKSTRNCEHWITQLKHEVKKSFYKIINKNINNACVLFAMVDRLTNPPVTLPAHVLNFSN